MCSGSTPNTTSPEVKPGYIRRLGGAFLIVGGCFFLVEHIMVWGGADMGDIPFGHEWYGILMIIIGFIINLRKNTNGDYLVPLPTLKKNL